MTSCTSSASVKLSSEDQFLSIHKECEPLLGKEYKQVSGKLISFSKKCSFESRVVSLAQRIFDGSTRIGIHSDDVADTKEAEQNFIWIKKFDQFIDQLSLLELQDGVQMKDSAQMKAIVCTMKHYVKYAESTIRMERITASFHRLEAYVKMRLEASTSSSSSEWPTPKNINALREETRKLESLLGNVALDAPTEADAREFYIVTQSKSHLRDATLQSSLPGITHKEIDWNNEKEAVLEETALAVRLSSLSLQPREIDKKQHHSYTDLRHTFEQACLFLTSNQKFILAFEALHKCEMLAYATSNWNIPMSEFDGKTFLEAYNEKITCFESAFEEILQTSCDQNILKDTPKGYYPLRELATRMASASNLEEVFKIFRVNLCANHDEWVLWYDERLTCWCMIRPVYEHDTGTFRKSIKSSSLKDFSLPLGNLSKGIIVSQASERWMQAAQEGKAALEQLLQFHTQYLIDTTESEPDLTWLTKQESFFQKIDKLKKGMLAFTRVPHLKLLYKDTDSEKIENIKKFLKSVSIVTTCDQQLLQYENEALHADNFYFSKLIEETTIKEVYEQLLNKRNEESKSLKSLLNKQAGQGLATDLTVRSNDLERFATYAHNVRNAEEASAVLTQCQATSKQWILGRSKRLNNEWVQYMYYSHTSVSTKGTVIERCISMPETLHAYLVSDWANGIAYAGNDTARFLKNPTTTSK